MKRALAASDLPHGFRFGATACGLKKNGRLDLALLTSDCPATAAAVFTTNQVQAAPVRLSRRHIRRAANRMRAVVVNAGNANCCTGPGGLAAARATAAGVAQELGCQPEEVVVCSTGVIGVPLPVERILAALPQLARKQSAAPKMFEQLTRAIMTTDTRPKWAAAICRVDGTAVRLLGCAKGAGMIEPNLATMLGFVATDATVSAPVLRRALSEAVARTFNSITVDGDTSTNDTVAVLANGASGACAIRSQGLDYRRFLAALETVCRCLALAIVADGEGAQRVIEVQVHGAPSDHAANRVARTIANSPLVKTAVAGSDPNWGRIQAAAGRAGVRFNPDRVHITLAGIKVFRAGKPLRFDERRAQRKLAGRKVSIMVDLHSGKGRATIWGCDFTAEYVNINASYRT